MATPRYLGLDTASPLTPAAPGKPVAWVFGLPLNINEALAFNAWEARAHTDEQLDTLKAWVVAMTLVHGSWVHEQMGGLGT